LLIGVVAWQLQAGQYGRPTREDRYAIPAFLATPYCMIPRLPDRFRRKVDIRRLEFLKANNVAFCSAKPVKEVRQTAIDVVDIEAGEFIGDFDRSVSLMLYCAAVADRSKPSSTTGKRAKGRRRQYI
jgi:hypothetical protein